MAVLPGLILALILAVAGQFLSEWIGKDLMALIGLFGSPIRSLPM